MAFAKKTLAVVFLVLTLLDVSLGTVHKVGDSLGWTIMGGVNYSSWASSKSFHVGDTLLFQYDEFHIVMQVTQQEFETCQAMSPLATYESGSDSITLETVGRYYFLCGVPGNCEAGMRFEVSVTANPAPAPHAPVPQNNALINYLGLFWTAITGAINSIFNVVSNVLYTSPH